MQNFTNEIDSTTRQSDTKKAYQSTQSVQTFCNENDLGKHINTHTNKKSYPCSKCDQFFSQKSYLDDHMQSHSGEKQYICSQCGKAFSHRRDLKRHDQTHTGGKLYQCNQCPNAFSRNDRLKTHMKIHIVEGLCDNTSSEKRTLKIHMRTHTGDKPYVCDQCEKAFTKQCALARHERTHTVEKLYQCNQCHKTFSRNYGLKCHMSIHTGDRQYQCNECDKSFTNNTNLKSHMRSHVAERPYQCNHCNKAFSQESNLVCHLRIHTGERPFQCSKCDKGFTSKSNLNTHMRTHTNEKPYQCTQCNKAFSVKTNLKRHIKTHTVSSRKKRKCIHPKCEEDFFYHKDLIKHLIQKHQVDIKIEQRTFSSWSEFLVWKEKEEAPNYIYFSKRTSTTVRNIATYSYFHCQRDGHSNPHRTKGDEKRKTARRNKKGVIKRDMFCPSRMICRVDVRGTVTVTYVQSHNHLRELKDTQHHPIPKSVLEQIKSKLILGASIDHIHIDLRDGLDSRNNRNESVDTLHKKHTITKRILRDLQGKLKKHKHINSDDATSVLYLVEMLRKEDHDPILLYKPQGSDFEVSTRNLGEYKINEKYKEDTFLLGYQTKEQLEMLEKHAGKIVCLDSTHCTNQYKFKLVTLVVQDEFKRGYPVGHLISNKEDEQSLFYFFDAIKSRCKESFVVNALMTDDDNAGWSAFKKVFGEKIPHLLCIWHVNRAWRRKLHQLLPHNLELQAELYQASRVLMDEPDESKFLEMAIMFVMRYSNICPKYVKYFYKYYLMRSKEWAMCFRNFPHGETDTTMYVESFHNRVKTYYMKRKPNKRLDDLLNLLMMIEKDDYYSHLLRTLNAEPENHPKKLARHVNGLQIMDSDVIEIDANKWEIKSQTTMKNHGTETYIIDLLNDACFEDFCFNRCYELSCIGLCRHMYKCSCKDKNGICKHIHKLHSVRVRSYQVQRFSPTELQVQESSDTDSTNEEPLIFCHTESVEENYKEKDSKILLNRAVSALKKIVNHLNDENVKKLGLSHICHTLEDLNITCETFKKTGEKTQIEFTVKDNIHPNSRIERIDPKLPKMRSTQNARQNKKNISLSQMEIIREMLLSGTNLISGTNPNEDISTTNMEEHGISTLNRPKVSTSDPIHYPNLPLSSLPILASHPQPSHSNLYPFPTPSSHATNSQPSYSTPTPHLTFPNPPILISSSNMHLSSQPSLSLPQYTHTFYSETQIIQPPLYKNLHVPSLSQHSTLNPHHRSDYIPPLSYSHPITSSHTNVQFPPISIPFQLSPTPPQLTHPDTPLLSTSPSHPLTLNPLYHSIHNTLSPILAPNPPISPMKSSNHINDYNLHSL